MKILITGGAGFIGSNFIRYLLNKYSDYEIVNLDKLTYAGNLDNLKDVENNPHYKFIKGDIAKEKDVAKAIKNGVDVIINFAAETHVDRSILGPKSFIITDIVGTYELLEAAKNYKVKKYIQISTDEVYGSLGETGEFSEDSPLSPNSPYSASKASADLLVRAYFKTYNLPTIIVRSVNVFGPYQYPEKIIPLFVTNLLENKKVPLYGDGSHRRQWVYVEDYCQALDLIFHQGEIGEIYNISSGWEISNLELTLKILKILNKPEEMIERVKDRPGHDWRYALNTDKIKALGWRPEKTFDERLEETINWYKENQWWWKKLKTGEYLKYYKKQYGK